MPIPTLRVRSEFVDDVLRDLDKVAAECNEIRRQHRASLTKAVRASIHELAIRKQMEAVVGRKLSKDEADQLTELGVLRRVYCLIVQDFHAREGAVWR